MDALKINHLLQSLINTNKKAILIDGPWGVGKTYGIKEFIDEHKNDKETKIIYITLFGKKTIEEIHTQIYSQIHPGVNLISKSLTVLSPATSLIPYAGDTVGKGLDFLLQTIDSKTDERNVKKEKKSKKQFLIILDDLERIDNELTHKSLLGYINQLFLLGMKVCVVCNSDEITDKNNFNTFKEKIFDREYKISKANNDVISTQFGNMVLDDEVIQNFNNNLRLVRKSYLFYSEIVEKINKDCTGENYKSLNNKTIIWYSALITSMLNKEINFELYKEKMESKINFARPHIFEYFDDEELAKKVECIYYADIASNYQYSGKNDKALRSETIDLICSITRFYLYDEFSSLKNILEIRKDDTGAVSIFDEKNIFYLSEKGKKEYIKKILKEFLNPNLIVNDKNFRILESIYSYKSLFPKSYNETKLVKNIALKIASLKEELKSIYFVDCDTNKDFQELFKKIESKTVYFKIKEMKNLISKIDINLIDNFYKIIQDLKEKRVYHEKGNSIRILKKIEDQFFKNSLFLPDLTNEITEEQWSLSHSIIDFLYSYGNKNRLKIYISRKIRSSSSTTEIERLNIFLNKYF